MTYSASKSFWDGSRASRLCSSVWNRRPLRKRCLLSGLLFLSTMTALGGCVVNTTPGTSRPEMGDPPMPGGRGGMMGPGMRGHGMMMGSPMMGSSMQRHRRTMMSGLPAAYRDLRNPLSANAGVISRGEALYQAHCATCHGRTGEGNGPAAAGMSPPPADLRWLMSRPIASDGYLMWALSEGGTILGTAMPAFKDALSENQRWTIIRYLQTL